MKLRIALLAATALALPVAVKAQPISGLYVGLGAGYNILQPEDRSGGGKFNFKDGFVGLGSVGYGLGNGLRIEIEGNYRDNKFYKTTTPAGAINPVGGDEQKYSGLVNVLYDFALLPTVTPYVGAGIGYAESQWKSVHATGSTGGTAFVSNRTEGSFAYQGIAGLGISTPIPGLAVTAEYRFFGLGQDTSYPFTGVSSAGVRTSGTFKTTTDYNHSFLLGLRYAFNAAPAAPTAEATPPSVVPTVTPTRTYLVFFDWDKSDLTDRARQIVSQAAQASTRVTFTKIQVNGYTDTSGTAQYNQALSIRRAKAVAAELVKDGVAAGAISISGFGQTNLLVPTGPGVREPQNRRVQILIQ